MLADGRAAVLGWQQTVEAAWQRNSDLLTPQALQAPPGPLGPATPPGEIPAPPPKGATAEQYAAYLRSLNEEQLRTVANKDGFAAELRDQANRVLLGRDRERLRADIARERAAGNSADADALQDRLNRLDVVAQQIRERPPGENNGYFLLGYDPAEDGRAIIARNNPDTAKNVATLVPGATTALDEHFGGTIRRIDALHDAAARAESPSTSVIAWLDYDAPEVNEVPFDSNANNASRDLDAFQDGLRASHIGERSHNTVVGHSYGALVAGITDRDHGLDVDELVSAGGVGLGVDRAADLQIAEGNVWATEVTADNVDGEDSTADVGRGHGWLRTDPTAPSFGAQEQVFESDAPVSLGNDTHGQYLTDTPDHRNPGLNNIGDIIAGKPPSHR